MKTFTPTELRSNVYRILDEILSSGVPVEIEKNGRRLRIIPVEAVDRLERLPRRPNVILGDPLELADLHWEQEISLDLP
ncbi:MAG: type II toxin-antitoxin system prevent-host-death family antitoxin [Candidatus Melainabacteria bacterium HGW-Melainabacteria-1]|nr:MAG: type II toxin-antitoxin system prevent-host-death family antitoxin [Candidatus Melainabacteria bacterium HGW-Melainabacteria-1]